MARRQQPKLNVPIAEPASRLAATDEYSQFGLVDMLTSELSWGRELRWRTSGGSAVARHVVSFLRVPLELERFLTFGQLLCLDLFLFNFTWLPLRFVAAVIAGLAAGAYALTRRSPALARVTAALAPMAATFSRASVYDLLKGVLLLASTAVLGTIQISRVYHYIRGEAVIKLYVAFNCLGVVDALLSSMGQDVMDALYRTTRDHLHLRIPEPTDHEAEADDSAGRAHGDAPAPTGATAAATAHLALHVVLAVAYVALHSCIVFVQIVCLSVALNSRNNALLTLLISSNFMELKGNVFKRFEAENLFQAACSDAVERFTLSLFLAVIAAQESASLPALIAVAPSVAIIWASEVLVDGVKHSFTTKFNRLSPDLFSTFAAVLAHDYIAVRQRMGHSLDPTHAAVRRLGIATLPVTCVVLRLGASAAWGAATAAAAAHPASFAAGAVIFWPRLSSPVGFLCVIVGIACLFALKVLLNLGLLVHAASVIGAQKAKLVSATVAAREAASVSRTTAAGAPGLKQGSKGTLHANSSGSTDAAAQAEAVAAVVLLEEISTVDRWTMRSRMVAF